MSNSSNQVLTAPLSRMMNVQGHDLISLIIVDDHNVVRQGIRAMLAIEDDIEILGEIWLIARMARLVVPVLPHHIIQRGNRRQETFQDGDYAAYVERMAEWRGFLQSAIHEEET